MRTRTLAQTLPLILPRMLTRALASVLLLLLVQGCAVQQWQSASIGRYRDSHSLADTLAELESQTPFNRDRPLYLLNKGLVHHLVGNYSQSNLDLEAAKVALEQVQALSVTEGLISTTLNETFNDYSATPSERVLLHTLMALNYLALNDLSSARVETLQSDLRMREIGDDNAQLASARFVAGLVFELNQEQSDAMISYRKAEQLLTRRQQAVPAALQARLLNSSRLLGLDSEHQGYLERFQSASTTLPDNYGEVLVLCFSGRVAAMQQRRISIYVPSLEHNVTISQPFYPPQLALLTASTLALGNDQVRLELLEDVDNLAREALQASQPKRIALSLARVTSKHMLVKNSRKKDPMLGLFADLVSILTEVADTRSWNLLPATMTKSPQIIEVKAGGTQLLIANSFGNITPLNY